MKQAILKKQQTITLQFGYDPRLVTEVKDIPGRRYNADNRTWEVSLTLTNLDKFLQFVLSNGFDLKEEVLQVVERMVEQKELLEQPLEEMEFVVPDTIKANLRPYQIEGAKFMVKYKRAMNGCEPGLGKTLMTIVALEAQAAYPALIVVPVSLKQNWENEWKKFCPERTVKQISSGDIIYSGSDVYVMNYDILKKHEARIKEMDFASVTFDESHKLKHSDSQRSKIARGIVKTIPVRYLLSGTPIEIRPSELINQINTLDRMDDMGGYKYFTDRYCDAKMSYGRRDISGASNTQELNQQMSKFFYFRRNKSEVLTELPPKQYHNLTVEISNRKEYNKAVDDLISYIQEKVLGDAEIKTYLETVPTQDRDKVEAAIMRKVANKVSGAEHLVSMTTLRKVAALGKLDYAAEWIENFIEGGQKLLVFAHHTEPLVRLTQKFKTEKITGETQNRQAIADRFQSDPEFKVLFLNMQAGGVGLNLTAASSVLFLEEPWSPSLKEQCCDRSHRIGQLDSVNIYTLLGLNTIDEDIHELLYERGNVVSSVNKGEQLDEHQASVFQEVFKRFMDKNTS